MAVAERMLELLDGPAAAGPGGPLRAPSPAIAPIRLEGVAFAYPARARARARRARARARAGRDGGARRRERRRQEHRRRAAPGAPATDGRPRDDRRRRPRRLRPGRVAPAGGLGAQHPALLRGTVADNIRLGTPSASDDLVRTAAAQAGADAFIRALPAGYDDGRRRRRAPAVARRATADRARAGAPARRAAGGPRRADGRPGPGERRGRRRGRRRLAAGRTVLLIAHRPELVARADRVRRLERGAPSPSWSERRHDGDAAPAARVRARAARARRAGRRARCARRCSAASA